jgi:uncharacterized protein YyaL (SSP411 family)
MNGRPKHTRATPSATPRRANKLIDTGNPYLLQHAHNPVDWFPWSDEAFEKARKEDKPVFLSIGYSTCHWCHVMERESFENEQIAAIMNEHFISIKVDRESRPDIDTIYMNAVAAMTGSGGWPLSVFLTPDGKPFYGGTYFPPKDSFGHPGFERVLLTIADSWKNRRQELLESAGRLSELLKEGITPASKEALSADILTVAFNHLREAFDPVNGGFGAAPKFPQPTTLSMLLCYWYRTGDKQALEMVEKTLAAMVKGGIYDHIGGGFHRYSTDARWLVPHFEKMLTDQALISRVYLEAYQITNNETYAEIAREIFDYVLRDMTDSVGGFYSAEDADSEGKEGAFYLWNPAQTISVLGKDQADIFNTYYGITEKGNFEDGKTVLNVQASAATDRSAREAVFQARQKRVRPHRDDKVITAWNGLMISSLAFGGAVLDKEEYITAAGRCADFILSTLRKNGRLMRYYRAGKARELAFLDDYAFMAIACFELYEATFDARWLSEANALVEQMVELFADEKGGFFLTGKDAEVLITCTKPATDEAVPSGNSVAAVVLLKLGLLTINQQLTQLGGAVLEAFWRQLTQWPQYSPAMLMALGFRLGPNQEIVIAGDADSADTKQMLVLLRGRFLPNAVVLLHQSGQAGKKIEQLVPLIKNQTPVDDRATAYVCENYTCKQPVNDVKKLAELLAGLNPAK